jgi:hypothetical protein
MIVQQTILSADEEKRQRVLDEILAKKSERRIMNNSHDIGSARGSSRNIALTPDYKELDFA